MKKSIFFLAPVLATAATLPVSANLSVDTPLGVEVTTSYRSEYSYRGFILASDSVDVQLAGALSLSDDSTLDFGAWYGSETGNGAFSETGLYTDLSYDTGDFTYSLSLTYHNYNNTLLKSGLDAGLSGTWHFNDEIDLEAGVYYDTGAKGWYGETLASIYHRINDDSFLVLKSGISFASSYYGRSGTNDVFARLSYTYNINENTSITPFAGASLLTDSKHTGRDSFFSGLHFAVMF